LLEPFSCHTAKWQTGEIAMKHFSMILVMLFGMHGAVIAESGAPDSSSASQLPIYKDAHADIEARIADLMGRMSIDDKAQLLHPLFFGTRPNSRLGIPALKFIDGSYGVRCGESTSFCALVNHAATWDPDLISRVGVALAEEIKSKGRNMLLGPVIYMHRIPQGGRNAESYSEDPYLAGTIVSSYIKAVQSQKIATTACFLAAKTQEYHVTAYDARVDERAFNRTYCLFCLHVFCFEFSFFAAPSHCGRISSIAPVRGFQSWHQSVKSWGCGGKAPTLV